MSKKKPGIIKLGIFLCAICAVSTAAMATVALMTKKPIEESRMKKLSDGLKLVLPAFDNNPTEDVRSFKASDGSEVDFYVAKKFGAIVGIAAKASSPHGYGGRVVGLVGFEPDGKIRTFIITGHKETPGLGTLVTDRARQRTIFDILGGKPMPEGLPSNKYLDQFDGHSASDGAWKTPWEVAKDGGDVDARTGATISSRAVTDIAWKAASALQGHISEIVPDAKKQ